MIEPEPLQQVRRTYVRLGGRTLSYFSGCDYFRMASHPEVLGALVQRGPAVRVERRRLAPHHGQPPALPGSRAATGAVLRRGERAVGAHGLHGRSHRRPSHGRAVLPRADGRGVAPRARGCRTVPGLPSASVQAPGPQGPPTPGPAVRGRRKTGAADGRDVFTGWRGGAPGGIRGGAASRRGYPAWTTPMAAACSADTAGGPSSMPAWPARGG